MIDNVLWIISARSGSKSVIDKNIKLLGKYPLFNYIYSSVSQISPNKNIWGSTDSKTYAKIFNDFGLSTPFIRPEHLATDDASSMDVVLHAMKYAEEKNFKKKYIGLLEPTNPFITSKDLSSAINILMNDKKSNSIVATVESRPNTFFIQKKDKYLNDLYEKFSNTDKLTRQNFSKQITPAGGFYISDWDQFIKTKTFYNYNTISYELDHIKGLEIDNIIDWNFAEFIIQNKLNEQ